ncbi:unnamed protein product [Camellia sinensis]
MASLKCLPNLRRLLSETSLTIFSPYSTHLESPRLFLWGRTAYHFALLYPDRVSAVITLGVPFLLTGPEAFPRQFIPGGFYMLRWQEPGRAEKDFGRFDVKTVVKNIYILFSESELPIAGEDQGIMDLVDPSTPLPPWFSEEDLANYATLYEKSGFRTPLQVPYRAWLQDYGVYKFHGIAEYITSGKVKEYVPDLEITFMPEGTHFVQEQFPDQ